MTAYPNFGMTNVVPTIPFPTTIAESGSWTSGVIVNARNPAILAAAISSEAGTISIQRYADLAGTIPVGAVGIGDLVATEAGYATISDGCPYLSYQVTITNSSGSTANVTGTAILTGPLA